MNIFPESQILYNNYLKNINSLSQEHGFNETHLEFLDLAPKDLEETRNKYKLDAEPIFEKEYSKLITDNVFFWGCSSKLYQSSYEDRLQEFLTEYFEAEEIDFLSKEFKFYFTEKITYPPFYDKLETKSHRNITMSTVKKLRFLKDRANVLGYDIVEMENEDQYGRFRVYEIENDTPLSKIDKSLPQLSDSISWNGTDLELSEILKALIEAKKLEGKTQKKIFETVFNVLGVKYSDSIKKERLSNIADRSNNKTPFLDLLHRRLETWIDRKDNK